MLRTTETKEADLNGYRSPVEDFYELMISDLEFAISWLPVVPENPDEYSRATKKSAMGMLARILLTRAYYSMDKNNQAEADQYFERAVNMAHAAIDSAALWGVALYSNYAELWDNANNNKNCMEALYVISNSTNPNLNYDFNGNRLHIWFLGKYFDKPGMQRSLEYGYDDGARFMPTQFLLDLFDEAVDSRYEASFRTLWKCNAPGYIWQESDILRYGKDTSLLGDSIALGDTALFVTKDVVPGKRMKNYVVIDRDSLFRADTIYGPTNIYPSLKKYHDPFRTEEEVNTQPGYNDIIVIRLAEMYLIAAEAEFQLGDIAGAVRDINVIRNRASYTHGNDMDITADSLSLARGLDFILDERARELAGEHLRWFDLKRTRTLVQRIEKYNKDIQIPSNLTEKGNGIFENVLLRPVPITEFDGLLNPDEFGQNPGYN